MFYCLKRLNEISPDVREDYIHVISVDRDQVGDNKGGGGPADQKDGQKAQSLRPPEHLGQMWDLKSPSGPTLPSGRFTVLVEWSFSGVLPTVTWWREPKKKKRKVKEGCNPDMDAADVTVPSSP